MNRAKFSGAVQGNCAVTFFQEHFIAIHDCLIRESFALLVMAGRVAEKIQFGDVQTMSNGKLLLALDT